MMHSAEAGTLKRCCSSAYESDFARKILGDSFHPGGLDLTRRLGELLGLGPGLRVLDVASGKGESAIFLAKEFGCEVIGIDFGAKNVGDATERADAAGVSHLVTFREGDGEHLEFADAVFDRVICECAFCTFPNKPSAAREFGRVLRSNGQIGMSDLTRRGSIPVELGGLLSWIACIADARPIAEYIDVFESASLHVATIEIHDNCLLQMAREVQSKLLGLELLTGLKKLDLTGVDMTQAKQFAKSAMTAIQQGVFGYVVLIATRHFRRGDT
jgi:ubiquinone/menaquinone biosynthesis C-methylase UbiE